MIHIDRERPDEEAATPIQPDGAWKALAEEELEVALREAEDHVAARAIYSHPWLRAVLEKLFHDKCAYCETKIAGSGDWNVDHFRPKGRVAERPDHPGYYWLAYEWSNLLPSCTHCNQRRKDKPRWGDLRFARAGGKADQFPLADESARAMSPADDLRREQALLIDPCVEQPENWLRFIARGEVWSLDGNPKGRTSIAVFHLNRRRLRDLRKRTTDTVAQLLLLIRALEATGRAEAARDFRRFLNRTFLDDACQYAAAARAVVEDPESFGI